MSEIVIQVESLSKKYDLGVLGTGTLRHDLNRWWHRIRGRGDPYAPIDPAKKPSPNGAKSSLEAQDLSREEIWALRDVSFEVKQGEILGIIGRNGAGKSTLLKILSRTTAPTTGEVRVKGRIASLLEVGTGFHPDLTGRENVFLNGAILGMTHKEIRAKFDEIVAFSEVERFIDTPVKRYSSGMYVRLAFAVAAHLEPEILIVDEVLAVGDQQFQNKCVGKMQQVSRSGGRTVLFVSHNLATVQKLCSKAILLRAGEIEASGPTPVVLDRYLRSSESLARASVDLDSPDTIRRGTGRIKFRTARIIDEEGCPIAELAMGQPFIVELTIISTIVDSFVFLGFSFITSDEIELMGTTAHDGGADTSVTPGEHVLTCKISPNVLLPGRYVIRAAVFNQRECYDHIDSVLAFEISEVRGEDARGPKSHKVGHVYLPYKWDTGIAAPAGA